MIYVAFGLGIFAGFAIGLVVAFLIDNVAFRRSQERDNNAT